MTLTLESVRTELIFGGVFAAAAVASTLVARRATAGKGALEKGFITLRAKLVGFVPMVAVLWFLLPQTASLSTFGYPDHIKDIQSPELLLDLLQDYNRALVQTTQVVHYFLLVFVVWFVPAIYALSGLAQAAVQAVPSNSDEPPA